MDISQYTSFTASQAILASRAAQAQAGASNDLIQSAAHIGTDDPRDKAKVNSSSNLFDTLIDTVNPLQHIPGVNGVYQEVTGDKSNALSSMAGGFLFGGPLGLAAGAAGSFLEMLTGKSLMGHAMAMFSGADDEQVEPDGSVQTAALGDGDPLLAQNEGVSLAQYQSFATATNGIHQGFGAAATEVGWADNLWTQQALKQAMGQYESQQRLGGDAQNRTERLV